MVEEITKMNNGIEIEDRNGNQDQDGTNGNSDLLEEKVDEESLGGLTKDQLIEKIMELNGGAAKNYDLYLRSQAEIENMKKRFQRDKEDLAKYCNDSLLKQLLPVMDSLETALAHSEKEESFQALVEGMKLTLKEFQSTLKKAGLEDIEAVGQPFDPNFHEAMYELEDENKEPGIVIEELQKGYLLNSRLLRPAKVAVSKGKGPGK